MALLDLGKIAHEVIDVDIDSADEKPYKRINKFGTFPILIHKGQKIG